MIPASFILLLAYAAGLRLRLSRERVHSRRLRRERDEARIERDFYVRAVKEADAEIADLKEVITGALAERN